MSWNRVLANKTSPTSHLEQVTPPAILPVTLADLKLFARIDVDAEDTLLNAFLATATRAAEAYCRRSFIEQAWRLRITAWPGTGIVRLPRAPLLAVSSVEYLRETGTTELTLCSSWYCYDNSVHPGQLVLRDDMTVVSPTDTGPWLIAINYTGGYGATAADVPDPIKQGILFWATAIYESRAPGAAPPEIAASVLAPYRVPLI